MANLCSIATGNWTAAATWSLVDTTSYLATTESSTSTVPTSAGATARSLGFTPGAITITGIAVRLGSRLGTTGTFTVELWNNTGSAVVAGTTVTINCSDLGAALAINVDGGWIVFDFADVALSAATEYMVQCTTSNATQINLFRDATANNWGRMLLTSTTQAPVAGDDVVVAGNYTGAGTGNDFTVTMNETATTDYGSAPTAANSLLTPGVAVAARGTLQYGTTAATNYYLKMSNSIVVYRNGTMNIGTTGTPIPRDSTAVLEFDPAADGDYGLIARNGSTLNIQGLSRTSGKNIVSCKLTSDEPGVANLCSTISTNTNTTDSFNAAIGPHGELNVSQSVTDNTTNGQHTVSSTSVGTFSNTTQVFTVWLARGTGTNNRFVRMQMGSVATISSGNGFFADIDLQAGTIGACTAYGLGTGTSSAILAEGTGYWCTIIGIVSSGSSAVLPCIAACSAAGTTTYIGDTTNNFNFYGFQVYTAAALPSFSMSVDTDTGWLDGDLIAMASTTRTDEECEAFELDGNAGASSFTTTFSPIQNHHGTSPTQAEIILLTRNVKVRSANAAFAAYCNLREEATVDIDWAEFRYLGDSATGKRGIECNTTTGSCNIQFCSLYDARDNGFRISGTAANNVTFSNNGTFNLGAIAGPSVGYSNSTTGACVISNNIFLKQAGTASLVVLFDAGGTFSNNVVVGSSSIGIEISESTSLIGTFSGNTIHSNGSTGLALTAAGVKGVISNTTIWRNAASGFLITTDFGTHSLMLDGLVMFGNTTSNISIIEDCSIWIRDLVSNGDTTFGTGIGISLSGGNRTMNVILDNCDFSTVSGIMGAHSTADLSLSATDQHYEIIARNCKFGAATEVSNQTSIAALGYIASQKHDQTAGNHKTWMRYGTLNTDSTISNTVAPSMRMTPNNASFKLESAYQFNGIQVAVANGATVTVNVYTRRSSAGDGAAYTGSQPRLIVKANPAIGITSDTVLDTHTAADGTWEQLTGTTAAATDDGVMEFVVDCDGTAGFINVDDWSAS